MTRQNAAQLAGILRPNAAPVVIQEQPPQAFMPKRTNHFTA
jgi:hypothetical protein